MTEHKHTVNITDIASLRAKYAYDPDTGVVTRRVRLYRWPAGTEVGTLDDDGYLRWKRRDGHCPLTHLIWVLYYGQFPILEIDHINGDRADNRISNLREVTRSQQMMNRGTFANKRVPFKGVSIDKRYGTYRASIQANGRWRHLGTFKTPEEAHAAYAAASELYHGTFGRLT